MIRSTVSSRFSFCWLYRGSPSSAAKNLILVLTIWWCPCVESSLVVGRRVFALTRAISWQNSVSLCPASFCTPRPNVSVTPGSSWLPTFAFQSPTMKRTFFGGVNSRSLVGWMVCLGNDQRSFCRFWDCIQVLHFRLFRWLWSLLHFF